MYAIEVHDLRRRTLILTTFDGPGFLKRAMESGAPGFLLKAAPAAALSEGESPLTPREHEVLAAARAHPTAAELAGTLYLSEGTVRNYLSSAIRKLGARNRVEAVRIAEEKGWL